MSESDTAAVKEYMRKETLSFEDVEHLRKLVYGSEKNRNIVKNIMEEMEGDASSRRNAAKAYTLALAYWFADRDDEAIELLGKNLKSHEAYLNYVSWCLLKERFSHAYEKAAEGVKKYAGEMKLKLLCAQAAVRCGNLKEAQKIIRELGKKLPPLDLDALRSRTPESEPPEDKTARDDGAPGKPPAVAPRYPDHSRLLFVQGLQEEANGNWEDAIEFFDSAIVADGENIQAHFRKAYNLDLRGMDEEALQTYEQARHLRPLHANILFNLGVLYEDTGKNRKAAQCYKTILEDNPTHMQAKLFLRDAEASRHMVYDEEEEKEQDKLLQILNTPITDFELSVRSRNCLAKMNIRTLGDLSRKTETELLSYKNFGETSLAEIKTLLSAKNLTLGMGTEEFFGIDDAEETADVFDEKEDMPDLLDTPLHAMGFSVRCKSAFEKIGLHTLGELANTKESEFQALRNFGQTSLNELKGKLAEYGMALKSS